MRSWRSIVVLVILTGLVLTLLWAWSVLAALPQCFPGTSREVCERGT